MDILKELLPLLDDIGLPPKAAGYIQKGLAGVRILQAVVEHLRQFAARNGRLPTAAEWEALDVEYSALVAEFDRIEAALKAKGQ